MHIAFYKRGETNINITAIVGILLLAIIIIVALLRDRIVSPQWREVSVVGTGEVEYTPDNALITLGVHVDNAATAAAALERVNQTINSVIPALTNLGIPRENITTQGYNLYPQYFYPENKAAQVSGYTADQQLVIKVDIKDSTDLIGRAIEAASAQGINQVQGISFMPSDVEALKHQALLKAIEDAKSKAEVTAEAAGVDLKKVIGWWETPIYVPGPGNQIPYGGYGGEMMARDQAVNAGAMPMIPQGTQKVIVQVNLNYSVR